MTAEADVVIWDSPTGATVPAHISQPHEIAEFAKQLTTRERSQVTKAYQDGSYELATTFVWQRAMASLKRELGALGLTFLNSST
jgi:hypothetical protein